MKKLKNIFLPFLLTIFLAFSVSTIFASSNPPNPPGNGHGTGNDEEPGGGAPIGSGIMLLLSLGAAYGGKKVYNLKKKETSIN